MISEAFQSQAPGAGPEAGPEPSPEASAPAPPESEATGDGGLPVSDAIRRCAGLIRAVFGRDIPDQIYAQISLDPELPIAILTAIGCEDESIDFLTNLSAKAKHRIAIGTFGVFIAADIAKLILARRDMASQIKETQQQRAQSRPQREKDIREEVKRQDRQDRQR